MTRKVMIAGLFRKLGSVRTLLLVGLINQYPLLCAPNKGGWFKPHHPVLRRSLRVNEPAYWAALHSLGELGLVSEAKHKEDGKVLQIEFEAINTYLRGWRWQRAVTDLAMAFRYAFGRSTRAIKAKA